MMDRMYTMLLLNFITPFVMMYVGSIFKKHPVKDRTTQNGYNTPLSRKSQAHWDYAQSIAPDIFLSIGRFACAFELVFNLFLFFCRVPIDTALTAGTATGLLFLAGGFYKTEQKLKQKFKSE